MKKLLPREQQPYAMHILHTISYLEATNMATRDSRMSRKVVEPIVPLSAAAVALDTLKGRQTRAAEALLDRGENDPPMPHCS